MEEARACECVATLTFEKEKTIAHHLE
jgi:hypothetical protein